MNTTADADVIRCLNCGAANRVPREKIAMGLQPVCGRCKKPLSCASIPVTVTDATFSAEVEASALPVLLDLWAPWCGPVPLDRPGNGTTRVRNGGEGPRRKDERGREPRDRVTIQRALDSVPAGAAQRQGNRPNRRCPAQAGNSPAPGTCFGLRRSMISPKVTTRGMLGQ